MENKTLSILIETAQKEKTPVALQHATLALYHITRNTESFDVLVAASDLARMAFNMYDSNRTDDNQHYFEEMRACANLAVDIHEKIDELTARLYDLQYDITSYEGLNDDEE